MAQPTKSSFIDNLKQIGSDESFSAECRRLARTLKLINGRTNPEDKDNVGSHIIVEIPTGFIQFLDNVRAGDLHSYIMEVSPVTNADVAEPSISTDYQSVLEACGFSPLGKYGIWRREFDSLASRNYDGLAQLTIGLLVNYYGLKPADCLDIQFHVQNVINRLIPVDEVRYLTRRNYTDFRDFFVYLIEENFDSYTYTQITGKDDIPRIKRLVDFMDAFLTVALEFIDELKGDDPIPYEVIDEIENLHTIINQKLIDLKAEYKAELYN